MVNASLKTNKILVLKDPHTNAPLAVKCKHHKRHGEERHHPRKEISNSSHLSILLDETHPLATERCTSNNGTSVSLVLGLLNCGSGPRITIVL